MTNKEQFYLEKLFTRLEELQLSNLDSYTIDRINYWYKTHRGSRTKDGLNLAIRMGLGLRKATIQGQLHKLVEQLDKMSNNGNYVNDLTIDGGSQ